MTYEDYMNHAKKLYLQGVDASGEQRRFYLTQALNEKNIMYFIYLVANSVPNSL